jgi:hypothetical protein
MTSLSLVLAFDSDDPGFRRGVEVGVLWQRLEHEAPVRATVHADCAEMIMRIAEARRLSFAAERVDDTWLYVTIGPPDTLAGLPGHKRT